MITILTHSYDVRTKEFWKWVARKLIRKYTGPDAVRDSVTQGLAELGEKYELDPFFPKGRIVLALSGIEALKRAIKRKQMNQVDMILAGPNIYADPWSQEALSTYSFVDKIIIPSEWIRELFTDPAPWAAEKIVVWPAGVKIPVLPSSRDGKILIFNKTKDDTVILAKLEALLARMNHDYQKFTYGAFTHSDYLDALKKATLLIVIGGTESQGLAIQEAWAYDVPTLVLRRTEWVHPNIIVKGDNLAAPYLDNRNGLFFEVSEIESKLAHFIENLAPHLHPRDMCIAELSNRASATQLANIMRATNRQ